MEITWGELYTASEWLIRIAMLFYVPYRRDAASARVWLLMIFFMPWLGLPLYAIFGRVYLPKRRLARQQVIYQAIENITPTQPVITSLFRQSSPMQLWPALDLTDALSKFPVVGGNNFELISHYHEAIERLIADIDGARSYVHLMYYIYANDEIGQKVTDALIRALHRGVTVRILMDAIGARDGLKNLAPVLRSAGAEVIASLPFRMFGSERLRFDLRNHRKIVVIDGSVAFFGSQNIVSPTANEGLTNEEIVVRAQGEIVKQLHAVLLADRYLETADIPTEVTHDFSQPVSELPAFAQALPNGPGYSADATENVMAGLLYAAMSRVVLTTPYFVPSPQFIIAMCNAARRGVAVHLIVDSTSNKRFVQLAQESYYDTLLEAGVHIHCYYGNFLHAKLMSVDSSVSLIGSSNLDWRSFELNEEISVIIYDQAVTADLWRIEQGYLAKANEIDPVIWAKRSTKKKLLESVARLFDSLM